MKVTFSDSQLKKIYSTLEKSDSKIPVSQTLSRNPVHVIYGGAHLFSRDTPRKLGAIALRSLETYAPDFAEFARAMWLKGADTLPQHSDAVHNLEFQLVKNEEKVKSENF